MGNLPAVGKSRSFADHTTREHYAAFYARPHAIHAAFDQFGTCNQDALDNKTLLAKEGNLKMLVLAARVVRSLQAVAVGDLNVTAKNVQSDIIPGWDIGSWKCIRKATLAMIVTFGEIGIIAEPYYLSLAYW